MELEFGQGRILISTFDLEDNVGVTPAADILADRIVDYVAGLHGKSESKGLVAYLGKGPWGKILPKMGALMAEKVDQARVVVLGKGHGMSDASVRSLLSSGRNVLLLRGAELPGFTGWSWDQSAGDFYGTTDVAVWPETKALSISDFHSRAPYPFWRLKGEGVASEGMLARKQVGKGVMIATSFDPTWIRTKEQPFMRLTGWRHSRNLVSMISAMGGAFSLDTQVFDQFTLPTGRLALSGDWKMKWTKVLPAAKKPGMIQDEGVSPAALAAVADDADTSAGWFSYQVPSNADDADPNNLGVDGEMVLQKKLNVPAQWAGEDLLLKLGRVDDHDVTYWNGKKIGSTGAEHPQPHAAERIYRIKAEDVKVGENVLSVRVMDLFGGSGITSKEIPAFVVRPSDPALQFYHPDYRLDFAYGDDAYRYYRW